MAILGRMKNSTKHLVVGLGSRRSVWSERLELAGIVALILGIVGGSVGALLAMLWLLVRVVRWAWSGA